ncbi:MAG: DUF551 domain-containing protein [Bacteroidota bacterium]|nr:DUF551 domain-containing protein [Bacteroidota bacterium]
MTREERALKNLKQMCNDGRYLGSGSYIPLEVLEDFNLAIKVIEQEPRWIPVSERMPEECTAVLVWCPERRNIYCAYYEEKRWWIFGAYWARIDIEVIAWMPLPCYTRKR